jgi:hypothetical protein
MSMNTESGFSLLASVSLIIPDVTKSVGGIEYPTNPTRTVGRLNA